MASIEEIMQVSSVVSAQSQGMVVIRPDMIGTVTYLVGTKVYIDIVVHAASGQWLPIACTEDGNCMPLFPNMPFNGVPVRVSFQNIAPPKGLFSFEEFVAVGDRDPKDVYDMVYDRVRDVVRMPHESLYDLLTTFVLYTWLHNLFSKKPNLYVTGFFGTGKSVVGNVVRYLGRHATDLLTSMTASSMWTIGITRGVAILDETDRISATFRMILRRMHDAGIQINKMMADEWGWNILALDISAPVVFVGTHLPEDPALLSRGFIIKMHYGKPRKRLYGFSNEAKIMRAVIARSLIVRWRHYQTAIDDVVKEVEDLEIHERYKDLIIPLAAVAKMCRRGYEWLYIVASYSSAASMYQLRTNRAIMYIIDYIERNAPVVADLYAVTEKEFTVLLSEVKSMFNLSDSEVKYVDQYFISASEPCYVDGAPGYCFKVDDVRGVKKLYFGAVLHVDRKRGDIGIDISYGRR